MGLEVVHFMFKNNENPIGQLNKLLLLHSSMFLCFEKKNLDLIYSVAMK